MEMGTCFLMVITFVVVAGQALEEIWIKTKNAGSVHALDTENVYDYYTSLSDYHLFPAQNRSIHFSVKACYGVFILLSAAVDLNSPDFYEICVGCGYISSYTFLRRKYNTGQTQTSYTPEITNCAVHVTLTLRWTVVGRIILTKDTDDETVVIINWTDPTPLAIQGMGIMTAWGNDGIWILKHVCQALEEIWIKTKNAGSVHALDTENVYDYYTSLSDYHLFPAQNRSIHFSVKACYGVFILLSAAVDLNSPDFYEICVGCGYISSYTFLRRKYNTGQTQTSYTPEITNCAVHVTLTLRWTVVGRIILTKDTDDETVVIINWTDPTPLAIQGMGIMTAWGNDGIWILKHVSMFTGHYCGEPEQYGNMRLLNIVMQPSKISCLLECANNVACLGVNFNAKTSKCQLVAGRQLIVNSFAQDWKFYTKCLAGNKMCLACLDI